MGTTLRDKFYGCICGCHIGSAMGAPVEGMPYPFGYATSINPHTNSKCTLRENADGIVGSPCNSGMEQVKIFPVGNKELSQVQ